MAKKSIRKSQYIRVLNWMKAGNKITTMSAVKDLGICGVHARLKEIRDDGHPLKECWVTNPYTGAKYKEYWMD